MDYEKMYGDMQDVIDRLEEEEIGVHFGSPEYKNAKEASAKVRESWEKIKEKGADYQMSDYEVEQIRQQMEEASETIDAYLVKKQREEARKGQLDTKGFYRVEAMRGAKRKMESQITAMDEIAAERGIGQPLPSDKQLEQQRKDLATELSDAQANVHMGSKEFDTAQKEYEKLNDLWSSTMSTKSDDELPTPGEIETLRASVERTRASVDDYLLKKAEVNEPGPKTQKRITAMNRVKENLDVQARKLEEWEKKLAAKEPEKSFDELADSTNYLVEQMKAADKNVSFGSNEYKEVSKLLQEQEKKWKELADKGPDYKMSPEELKEMVELNQKMEKAADKYIQNKAGQELSPKTQKRLRTIQKVKNHALSQRRKFEARRDEMLKEVEGLSNQEVENRSRDVSKELRNADRKVYFGSKEYQNAMKTYNRSLDRWEKYKEKEEKGIATPKERETEKKALSANIKEIDKYLDKKKKTNLDKNPKTKKRVETMQKAKRNMELRIRKIEAAEKKIQKEQKAQRLKEVQEKKKNLKLGIKSQQSLERNMSRSSMAAIKQLELQGSRRTLSAMDKRNARIALATLVLEEKLRQPGNEQLKRSLSKSGKQYAKEVNRLANSKEFKAAFPDSTFTPTNCKNLSNDPRIVKRCAKEFDNRLVQKERAKLQKQQQKQKELNKNKNMERKNS